MFSIVVATYNRTDDLTRCLSALQAQTDRDFEVVVVNGGEAEPVRRIVADFAQLSIGLVEQKKKGIVEARNLGWQNASGEVVCFIDDDLVVSPGWLAEVRRAFNSSPDIGGVSGPTIIPEGIRGKRDFLAFFEPAAGRAQGLFAAAGTVYKSIVLEDRVRDVGRILASGAFTPGSNFESCLSLQGLPEVDYLEACCMCFRRFLLEDLGGFSYAYTGTGEWNEPDFAFKVKSRGYRLVFNPKAAAEHRISRAGVFQARTFAYERSRNFIHFYFTGVRPDTPEKAVRFGVNLIFMNGYWCYKFIQTGNLDWLSGIWGTLLGLAKEMCA